MITIDRNGGIRIFFYWEIPLLGTLILEFYRLKARPLSSLRNRYMELRRFAMELLNRNFTIWI
jgi:hypothetical protein